MRFALPQGYSHATPSSSTCATASTCSTPKGAERAQDDEHRHALPAAGPARPHARAAALSGPHREHDRVWVCRRMDIARHWKQVHPFNPGPPSSGSETVLALTSTQRRHAGRGFKPRCWTALRALALDRARRRWRSGPSSPWQHLKLALARWSTKAAGQATGADPRPPRAGRQGHGEQKLTAESTNEQSKAGLTDCTPEGVRAAPATQRRLQRQASAFPSSWRCAARAARACRKRRDHRHLRAPSGPPGPTNAPSACATSTALPRSA
jgi:hypothetical protein